MEADHDTAGKCRKFLAEDAWPRRALPCLVQDSIFRTLPSATRAPKICPNPRLSNAVATFENVPAPRKWIALRRRVSPGGMGANVSPHTHTPHTIRFTLQGHRTLGQDLPKPASLAEPIVLRLAKSLSASLWRPVLVVRIFPNDPAISPTTESNRNSL